MAAAAVPVPLGDANLIDHRDESDWQHYLNMAEDLKYSFNLTKQHAKTFHSNIDQHSVEAGWHDLFNIPENNVNNTPTIHDLANYGQLTLDQVAQIKTRADIQFAADTIRSILHQLSQTMVDKEHNINKFNGRALVTNLATCGLTPDESFYDRYKACTDKAFMEYLHNENPGCQYDAEAAGGLVTFAVNKYIQLLDREQPGQQTQPKPKKEWVKPAWKTDVPIDDQPKVKANQGKTYHWCHHHLQWTIHKPGECLKDPNKAMVHDLKALSAIKQE